MVEQDSNSVLSAKFMLQDTHSLIYLENREIVVKIQGIVNAKYSKN